MGIIYLTRMQTLLSATTLQILISATTRICSTFGMVATIGGKLNRPTGIGTVEWKWKDDDE